MHKNECDRCGGQMCSEENMKELCQEGHEGYEYKGGNSTGPLCLEEYNWGPTRASADALRTMCIWSHGRWTHMMMMNFSILKKHGCCRWNYAAMLYVCMLRYYYLLFGSRHLGFFYFRSHFTIQKIGPLNPWTCKIWVEQLKLCSYLVYNLRCWFVKVLKETCICGRHLGFLSDNIDAITVLFCSPTISRGSQQSILVSSMRFWDGSQPIGLVVILPLPLGPSLELRKVNLFNKFLIRIQKRIRDNILFELDKPHYHINQKMNRLSSVALSIQNKIRQYGN